MNKDHKLFRAIDSILWTDWDPIGMNLLPECSDEYTGYVPEIVALKVSGGSQEAIALKLYELARDAMEIELTMEFCMQVAERIVKV